MPGYTTSARTESGVSIHAGHPTGRMLVVVSGGACAEYQISRDWAVKHFPYDGRVSRLDLAVTVQSGVDYIALFVERVRAGDVVSKRFASESPKAIVDARGRVETQYLSDMKTRAKKGLFRAYDKAAERGLVMDGYLSRFELETKRENAHTAFKRWINGAMEGRLIRDVVDIPGCGWWVDVMGADNEPLKRWAEEPKESQTAVWLVEQVAPALARVIADDARNGTANAVAFGRAVGRALRGMQGQQT